jgi:hypothetical protein
MHQQNWLSSPFCPRKGRFFVQIIKQKPALPVCHSMQIHLFRRILISLFLISWALLSNAQEASLKGRVFNAANNEAIPFAVAVLSNGNTTFPVNSDIDGRFSITVSKPGLYNLQVMLTGFKTLNRYEIELKPGRLAEVDCPLEEDSKSIGEVTISGDAFMRREESPLSMRTVGVSEIKRNPGGNRDISKVLQSLPGVASVPTFRNDLIVRGGSPNENRFYLDGIEVPNINHFATQGASGGPVGLLNVDFISEVDFFSGAFPANRGNALSSVLDIKFKDARTDKAGASIALGATDLAFTFDGPLSEKSGLIASYRRSYLQFLFAALELPFLPTYNDFQFKYKYRPDNKQEFNFIGLGAYDVFNLNLNANETEEQLYLLGNLPENSQWNYTIGGSYKYYLDKGFITVVLSRNHLTNRAEKYANNDESEDDNRILEYVSQEIENKFRMERSTLNNGWKTNVGINLEQSGYTNETFNKIPFIGNLEYNSRIGFFRYGAFGQISKTYSGAGLILSLGGRLDANTFGENMGNPLEQFSPRFSISKTLGERFTVNANTGIFYQVPAYTILGFRNNDGALTNTEVPYIRSIHYVAGFEYQTRTNGRITIEGFYKQYSNYPLGLSDSISIANQGSDFGVVGDEPVDSRSRGRSYGLEVLLQQRLFKGFYGIISYTFVSSAFTNFTDELIASSWDYRHLVSLTAGKTFGKNWELGTRFRFNTGSPFTPFDAANSSLISNWDITGQGIRDVNRINSQRTEAFHQLDIRLDKKYYFKKWILDIFLDVQNVYNFIVQGPPYLTVIRGTDGLPQTDPNDPSRYLTRNIPNNNGTIIPSIGIIVEF